MQREHYIFIFCPLSDSITAGEEGETMFDTGSGTVSNMLSESLVYQSIVLSDGMLKKTVSK